MIEYLKKHKAWRNCGFANKEAHRAMADFRAGLVEFEDVLPEIKQWLPSHLQEVDEVTWCATPMRVRVDVTDKEEEMGDKARYLLNKAKKINEV